MTEEQFNGYDAKKVKGMLAATNPNVLTKKAVIDATAETKVRPKRLYFVWNTAENYFEQFDSIEDAVAANGGAAEIFGATRRLIS